MNSPQENILLIVGRNDWQRHDALSSALLDMFKDTGLQIIWEDPAAKLLYNIRRILRGFHPSVELNNMFCMRIIQILTSLAQPSYPYFAYNRRRGAIAARCKTLKKIIQRLDKPKHAIALSRSSGGRVSSLIADELQLKQIICLGYPFKHPTKNEQAERYQHLAKLRTPMLIFQGVKDQYGGSEVLEKYPLSPMVQVELVDTDHHFEIEHDRLQVIANKIQNIIESPTTES